MSVWDLLERFLHEAPPPATMGNSSTMQTSAQVQPAATATRAPVAGMKNIQLMNNELDALIKELENPKIPIVNGVDMKKLGDKLYQMKVKKESPMGGGGAEDGEAGAPQETEEEGTY